MTNIEKIRQEIERLYDGETPKHDQQCDFNDGYFTGIAAVSKFIDSLSDENLPDNLDEAANDYASKTECAVVACRGFKAGAKWMSKQGFISEGIVYQTPGKDTMIELNEHIGYLEDCDEVIVNIRQKQ